MKADIEIYFDTRPLFPCYWFRAENQFFGDHKGIKEQILAIVIGYAEPVEL